MACPANIDLKSPGYFVGETTYVDIDFESTIVGGNPDVFVCLPSDPDNKVAIPPADVTVVTVDQVYQVKYTPAEVGVFVFVAVTKSEPIRLIQWETEACSTVNTKPTTP